MSPQKRKQQLLRAGVSSIVNKGIGGTKHADLAKSCQVSVPTIFSYFPNRKVLITSILEDVGSAVIENVIVPAQALPAEEQLAATGPLFEEFAEREPDYVKAWLTWSMYFAPDIQAQYRQVESRLVEALAVMIQQGDPGIDPGEDAHDRARVICASSAFLAKMVFDGVSQARREAFVENLLNSLLRA